MRKICLFLFLFQLTCHGNEYLNDLVQKYKRPVTFLYVSHNPKWINVREDDVIVYWTKNQAFLEEVKMATPDNVIVLTANINHSRIKSLSTYEFFDIVIYDANLSTEYIVENCHMADYTFFINPKSHFGLQKVGQGLYLHKRPYTNFAYYFEEKQYPIISTFDEKVLVNTKNKKLLIMPGITCRTYFSHLGAYPPDLDVFIEEIDKINPFFSAGKRIRNSILRGVYLHGIDYNTDEKRNPARKFHPLLWKWQSTWHRIKG